MWGMRRALGTILGFMGESRADVSWHIVRAFSAMAVVLSLGNDPRKKGF